MKQVKQRDLFESTMKVGRRKERKTEGINERSKATMNMSRQKKSKVK